MQRIKLWLMLGALTFRAVSLLAQTGPAEKFERGLRPHPLNHVHSSAKSIDPWLRPEIRVFYLRDVQYWARISEAALLSGPDWVASKPLPLDFAKAEAIARQELRKLIPDDSTWEVQGFHLCSVRVNTREEDQLPQGSSALKWYFQVEMKPVSDPRLARTGQHSDSFWVFIDLAGRAGEIQVRNER